MNALLAAVCFGIAAAVAVLAYRQMSNERRIRQRSLEQLGLRAPVVKKSRAQLGDRRTILLLGVGGVVAIVGMAIVGPLALLFGAVPLVGDSMLKKRAARQRSAALAAGLAPALQLLVDNLRVGRDLVSALAEVSESADEPVASLFGTVVSEVRLGARVDAAFSDVAETDGDRHLSVVASAVGLNIEFGGNLVEILGSVIESIEEEDRLRRDIDSLTADGRLSSSVLLALPVLTLIVISALSPGYASPLINEPVGRLMSIAGVILGLVGWMWLRALSNPEVVA